MTEGVRADESAKDPSPIFQPEAQAYRNEDPAFQVFIDSIAYLDPAEIARVIEAYRFSEKAHAGQTRLSGEPYITHPLAVAGLLADWRLDVQAVIAALLHDVVEDTAVTKNEITARFGKQVADLVDGLSKLEKIEFQSYQQAQAENFRKMLMAMMSDLRVVLIKLADRLHNMQTMAFVRPDKRRRIARETLEIYVPVAMRIGLNNIARQLQDLSFQHIHPTRFNVLTKALKAVRGNRRELLAIEVFSQRLAHLTVLLDDLLERLTKVVAGARIIPLERLCSADVAPGDGLDRFGHGPACVPESVRAHGKQVYRAAQRTQQGEKLGCCDRPMGNADDRQDRSNNQHHEMDAQRSKEVLL